MKKSIFLLCFIFILTVSSFAQTANFAGEWMLDKAKSKLNERQKATVDSQILKAEQTENDIKVTVMTKLIEGVGGRNRVDLSGGTIIFTFDGKETTTEQQSEIGKISIKAKGAFKNDKLKLETTRSFNTPMGEVSLKTKEDWELSADGKTLTIKRETEAQGRTESSELTYIRKT